jgi:MoaA/NifB/PqqE/SkfB family radical SAM enzyme
MTTTVTTNGMLLTPDRINRLAGLVDVLAISLDGVPQSHATMRGDAKAFRVMESRLGVLRESGLTFGFVFTLTQSNVAELDWDTQFATDAGASLVQVHPLESEGFAAEQLLDQIPDVVELSFAALESLRLRLTSPAFVQFDVATRRDLKDSPERFLVYREPPTAPLGGWLTPLVLEADGVVVPITYGFPRQFALGNVRAECLSDLAHRWDSRPLLDLAAEVLAGLTADEGPALVNWYQELTQAAESAVGLESSQR